MRKNAAEGKTEVAQNDEQRWLTAHNLLDNPFRRNQRTTPRRTTRRSKQERRMNEEEQAGGYNSKDDDDDASNLPTLHHRFVRLNPRFDREETLRLLFKSESPLSQERRAVDVDVVVMPTFVFACFSSCGTR